MVTVGPDFMFKTDDYAAIAKTAAPDYMPVQDYNPGLLDQPLLGHELPGAVGPMANTLTAEGRHRLLVVLSFLHVKMVLDPAQTLTSYLRYCDAYMTNDEVEKLRADLLTASRMSRPKVIAAVIFLICFVPGYAYAAFPKECTQGCRLHDMLVSPVGFCVAPGLIALTLLLLWFMEFLTERAMTGQRDKIRNAVYMFYFMWIRSRTPKLHYVSNFGELKLLISLGYINLTLVMLILATSQHDTAVGFVVAYAMGELYCKALDFLLGASDELVQLITSWQQHFASRFSKAECLDKAFDQSFFSRLSTCGGTAFGLLEGEAFLIEKIEKCYYEEHGRQIPASKKRHIQRMSICIGGRCVYPVYPAQEDVMAAPAFASAAPAFTDPAPIRRAHTTGDIQQASKWGMEEFKAMVNGFMNMTPAETEAFMKFMFSLKDLVEKKLAPFDKSAKQTTSQTYQTDESYLESQSQEGLLGGIPEQEPLLPDPGAPFFDGNDQFEQQPPPMPYMPPMGYQGEQEPGAPFPPYPGPPMDSNSMPPMAFNEYGPPPAFPPETFNSYASDGLLTRMKTTWSLYSESAQAYKDEQAYREQLYNGTKKAEQWKRAMLWCKRLIAATAVAVFLTPYIFSALYFWDRFVKHR